VEPIESHVLENERMATSFRAATTATVVIIIITTITIIIIVAVVFVVVVVLTTAALIFAANVGVKIVSEIRAIKSEMATIIMITIITAIMMFG